MQNLQNCQASEILDIRRLRAKPDSTPPILVQFASTDIRQKWMSARKKVRSLSNVEYPQKIYFNENLTKANKELFWQARSKGKEERYTFVWVKNGTIFAKKAEGSIPVRVSKAGNLEKIV